MLFLARSLMDQIPCNRSNSLLVISRKSVSVIMPTSCLFFTTGRAPQPALRISAIASMMVASTSMVLGLGIIMSSTQQVVSPLVSVCLSRCRVMSREVTRPSSMPSAFSTGTYLIFFQSIISPTSSIMSWRSQVNKSVCMNSATLSLKGLYSRRSERSAFFHLWTGRSFF